MSNDSVITAWACTVYVGYRQWDCFHKVVSQNLRKARFRGIWIFFGGGENFGGIQIFGGIFFGGGEWDSDCMKDADMNPWLTGLSASPNAAPAHMFQHIDGIHKGFCPLNIPTVLHRNTHLLTLSEGEIIQYRRSDAIMCCMVSYWSSRMLQVIKDRIQYYVSKDHFDKQHDPKGVILLPKVATVLCAVSLLCCRLCVCVC